MQSWGSVTSANYCCIKFLLSVTPITFCKEYLLFQLSNGGEQKGVISGLQMSELGQKAVELLFLILLSEQMQS